MYVGINGPGEVTLTFDVETGMRVVSIVGEPFLPNVGIGLWVLELFAMYATDGHTDGRRNGRADKSNAYCPLPYGRGHNDPATVIASVQ